MSNPSHHVKRANMAAAEGVQAPQRRRRVARVAVFAFIVVTAAGVTALSISLRAAPAAPAAPAPPLAAMPVATALGAEPKPWEYDAVGNRHWNPEPGHQHWHNGPPPAPGESTGAASLSGPFSGQVPGNLGPVSLAPGGPQPIMPAPAGPQPGDPAAWQYDAATNQHWHPGHRHWHPGESPPPDQRQP